MLHLHEQRVVVILRGADELLDLAELRIDQAVREQTAVHGRQVVSRAGAGGWRNRAGRTDGVTGCALQWLEVRVVGGAGNNVYAVVPHGADG